MLYKSHCITEGIGCPLHMYAHLGHAAYEEAGDFNKMALDFFAK